MAISYTLSGLQYLGEVVFVAAIVALSIAARFKTRDDAFQELLPPKRLPERFEEQLKGTQEKPGANQEERFPAPQKKGSRIGGPPLLPTGSSWKVQLAMQILVSIPVLIGALYVIIFTPDTPNKSWAFSAVGLLLASG